MSLTTSLFIIKRLHENVLGTKPDHLVSQFVELVFCFKKIVSTMRCDICKLPVARMPSYSAYLLACLSFGHPLQVFFVLYLTERKRGRAARWSLLPIQDTVLYAFFDDLDNIGDKGFKNLTCINKPTHEAKETLRIQKLIQTNPHKNYISYT